MALVRDAHPGYISWDALRTASNDAPRQRRAHGADRRQSPPREGPALLQGLVICGRCGNG